MDPANVDRRRGLLLGVSDASLLVRSILIAGVTGKVEQRILSTTLHGESTRLIKTAAQWRAESSGHFTSSFDLLVLAGGLQINSRLVTPLTFLRIDKDSLISEFHCHKSTTALLCADGPLKFVSEVPKNIKELIFGDTFMVDSDLNLNTFSSHRLSPINVPRHFWLQRWGSDQDIQDKCWYHRTTSEECFVLRGCMDVGTSVHGSEQRFTYNVGGYYSLPPNVAKQSRAIFSKGPLLTIYICPAHSKIDKLN